MEPVSGAVLASVLALIGVVIIIAALLSGFIDRAHLPTVGVFILLGALLGPAGLGVLRIELTSPILQVVATLSLALVLFTDAVSLSIAEVRRHAGLAALILGPGTLISGALVSAAAWGLLGLPWPAAIALGASLASTDPVILRGLLRLRGVPEAARLGLRLESGLNDVALLPVVLVAMAFMVPDQQVTAGAVGRLLLNILVVGPVAGVVVALLSLGTLEFVRRRVGVRRDYESLYSLGICLAAYAAAEAVHGSGFLAAFVAGLTIAALDVELCDCFIEYGETTAEMALLFTFVLLGSSLIWTGFPLLTVGVAAFAVLALLVRPVAFLLSLAPARVDRRSRNLLAWFGPRGLSALLLVLLIAFARLPGAERVFAYASVVVVLSIVAHGGFVMAWRPGRPQQGGAGEPAPALPGPAEPPPVPVNVEPASPELIAIDELRAMVDSGQPVRVLDVRSAKSYDAATLAPAGACRIDPRRAVDDATQFRLPRDAWLATLCA